MSKRTTDDFGKEVIFIAPEEEQKCAYCGAFEETRPYGKDFARICFDCSQLPENIRETQINLNVKLFGDSREKAEKEVDQQMFIEKSIMNALANRNQDNDSNN